MLNTGTESEKGADRLHDKDIREPLFDFLEETYGRIRILEEKNIGRVRSDVVMVTESEIIGIEIKSDADTYARLARQVQYYDWYYDRNMVVAGSTHGHHIARHVPPWWGIITVELVDGQADFYILRKCQKNPNVKPDRKIRILWRTELAHLLARNRLPKYTGKSKDYIRGKLLERVPEDILWPQMMEELFQRDYTLL